MRLECCCCGGDAGDFKQWWNRDTGYGICVGCVTEQLELYGPEMVRDYYGEAGVHYEAPAAPRSIYWGEWEST